MNLEPFVLNTGAVLNAHRLEDCNAPCPLHAPSDHHMRDWPQVYRYREVDLGFMVYIDNRCIMERTCPHGVGHPDPDDLKIRTGEDGGIHGCDGCCRRD